MRTARDPQKSSWYTERGTYTMPSDVPGMEWICRMGKMIALVPKRAA